MSDTSRCRADLEDMSRDAVKRAPGCGHVIDIDLRYIENNGRRPNWCLAGTTPPLAPAALIEAAIAVERLADQYLMIDG